jgi:cytochrome c oxidase cbb3-type subunit III
MSRGFWLCLSWPLLFLTGAACWGQPLTNPFAGNPAAAEDGRKLFGQSCAPCHGRDGAGAQGQAEGMRPPDLTRGVFKAGKRDEDLFGVISGGVKGTVMPSFASLGADQIWRLIVFIRTLSATSPVLEGNPVAGDALFWGKGNCGSCHAIGARGGRLGPDLTQVRRSTAQSLKKSIVDPNDEITRGFAIITVETRDHKKISGMERWLDNFSARLVDSAGNERTFLREDVLSIRREMRSTMPDTYSKTFSETELNDVVAYILKARSEANSE